VAYFFGRPCSLKCGRAVICMFLCHRLNSLLELTLTERCDIRVQLQILQFLSMLSVIVLGLTFHWTPVQLVTSSIFNHRKSDIFRTCDVVLFWLMSIVYDQLAIRRSRAVTDNPTVALATTFCRILQAPRVMVVAKATMSWLHISAEVSIALQC